MSAHNRMPRSFNATPKPFNFQSSQNQSTATFPVKAVKAPTANSAPSLSQPINLDVNPNLINPNSAPAPVYQPSRPVAAPQTAPIKKFEPPVAPAKEYHDLAAPEKSGVLRLPTVNFKQQQVQQPARPNDAKTNALGNLSSFMNKKTGGGVTKGTLGKPDFLQPLVDRECPVGEPAVLEVRLAGSPPLTIQWYHNNQPMRESIERDIRLLQKGNVHTLVLGELSRGLLGRYTCQASNAKGTSTSSCVVTEGGYEGMDEYPTATYQHGPPAPKNPAYKSTVNSNQQGLPSQTKVVTKKPLNQLVTSGNASLYSSNAIEEGLHSALGIQQDHNQPSYYQDSAVMDAIEGRGDDRKQTSRTLARLAQQLDEDL